MKIIKHSIVQNNMWDRDIIFHLDNGQEKKIVEEAFGYLLFREGLDSFIDNIIAKEPRLGSEFAEALREYLRSTKL